MAEAEEAAALATRLMDAANRYEQQAQDFGHHHHPEGHVSPLECWSAVSLTSCTCLDTAQSIRLILSPALT